MPALTHGRVVNGFNAYPMVYKAQEKDIYSRCRPYSCNNSKHPNSNKSSITCKKKIYKPYSTIIPLKYQKSNSCTSQKCRRVLNNNKSKLGLSKNVYQRGIGESIQKNILNRKKSNKCNLQRGFNNKNYPQSVAELKNLNLCKCFKIF